MPSLCLCVVCGERPARTHISYLCRLCLRSLERSPHVSIAWAARRARAYERRRGRKALRDA